MKQNKKFHLYKALRQKILTLELAPSVTLDENALSKEFEISRTPLREVFQRLAGEGFLSLEANKGATVSAMDLAVMRTFFQTAPMIYAGVARLAAENATQKQIQVLKSIQQKFRISIRAEDTKASAMQNHAFHECMGHMAANPYLTPSLNRLLIDHTRMSQTFYRPSNADQRNRVSKACTQHDMMIEAIESRSPATVVDLVLEHWALSKDQIERFVQPDPLPVDFSTSTYERLRNAV